MIALIPARSGSKRILDKNFRDFCGRPVIEYSIDAALESELFDEIIIAIDHDKNGIIKHWGNCITYYRQEKNSTDQSTIFDIFQEVYLQWPDEYYCIIYPCAPLIQVNDLKKGFETLQQGVETGEDISIVDCVFPVYDGGEINKDLQYVARGLVRPVDRRHDRNYDMLDDGYKRAFHAGQWFMIRSKEILKSGTIVQKWKNGVVEIPKWRAGDINTEEDWKDAEIKYNGMMHKMAIK